MPSFSELELKFSACHENEFHYLADLHQEQEETQERNRRA